MARKRTLRARLDETTRDVIVDAAIEQLVEQGAFDFSYYALARRAGMSVRTIYRHFPTRDDLFDALSRRLDKVVGLDYSRDRAGILWITRAVFGVYDQHAQAFIAQLAAGQGRVRLRGRSKRVALMRDILAKDLPSIPTERLNAVAGLFICLFSPSIWQRLRDDAGLDGKAGGDVVAWAIDVMWSALEAEARRARR